MTDSRHDEDVRVATRALLRTPLLRAERDPDAFRLIRRHEADLHAWFERECGWTLVVEGDLARLRKRPATPGDGTRPAIDPTARRPFTRDHYVVLCLALATLERAGLQITLGRLAEDILVAAQEEALTAAGFGLVLERRVDRGRIVSVVRLLLGLGVLHRVAGSEEDYVDRTEDVLYDIDRRTLVLLTAAPNGASTIAAEHFEDRLAELTREPLSELEELRAQRARRSLTRRLVDDPVVYLEDLDDDERAYLAGQRAALVRRVSARCGLHAEIRAEGIAMVDPDDWLSDRRMPETGTEGHATLLVAEELAARGPTRIADLEELIRRKAAEHRTTWRRSAQEPGAERELTAGAIERLEALALITRDEGAVRPRPALARYAVAEPSLFGASS